MSELMEGSVWGYRVGWCDRMPWSAMSVDGWQRTADDRSQCLGAVGRWGRRVGVETTFIFCLASILSRRFQSIQHASKEKG